MQRKLVYNTNLKPKDLSTLKQRIARVLSSLDLGSSARLNIKESVMSDMYDSEFELYRNGLRTTIKVKSQSYDVVEFTLKKHLIDEQGRELVNNEYTSFYTHREFKDFLQPLVNQLKVRFDHEDSIKK